MGYNWLFVIDACTSFAAAILLYYYLPRSVNKARRHNEILKDSTTSAYRDIKYLLFILFVAFYGTCFFQLFASVPQYFSRVCHYNEDTIGLLLALNGFIVVVMEMPLIAYLEKDKRIFRYIIAGTLCLPVAFLLLLFSKGLLILALAYTLVITFSEIFAMPFMMNYVLSRPKKERQGQYSALYSIAFGIANITAPIIGLGVADKYGFSNMFVLIIVLSLITALGFFMLKKEQGYSKV